MCGGGTGERKRLNIKARTVEDGTAAVGESGGKSLFGGARPRELALEEKGRDWRKEEQQLARIDRYCNQKK